MFRSLMDPKVKIEITVTIVIHCIAAAFYCGAYWFTTRQNTKDIRELKTDVKEHDREIGALYGNNGWVREVRSR